MIFRWILLAGLLTVFLASAAGAGMPVGGKGGEAVRAEQGKKNINTKKAPAPVKSQVRSVAVLVDKIEGGVLFSGKNRYSLAGVQVVDLTRGRKAASGKGMTHKTAEMTFLNDRLKEVVIRAR